MTSRLVKQKGTKIMLTLALSEAGATFCLGIMWRQWDKTVNDFGKILSSPLLLFPDIKQSVVKKIQETRIDMVAHQAYNFP